jgi:pyruvate/2-oxoglutarate dehydrogenase complex dihydrolipoamide dehydrogenase (E3) component
VVPGRSSSVHRGPRAGDDGVRLERSSIVVDQYFRTSVSHIFAVGDANGRDMRRRHRRSRARLPAPDRRPTQGTHPRAHAVGENAVQVIQSVTTAMAAGADVATLASLKFTYPTYRALIGLAARRLLAG